MQTLRSLISAPSRRASSSTPTLARVPRLPTRSSGHFLAPVTLAGLLPSTSPPMAAGARKQGERGEGRGTKPNQTKSKTGIRQHGVSQSQRSPKTSAVVHTQHPEPSVFSRHERERCCWIAHPTTKKQNKLKSPARWQRARADSFSLWHRLGF